MYTLLYNYIDWYLHWYYFQIIYGETVKLVAIFIWKNNCTNGYLEFPLYWKHKIYYNCSGRAWTIVKLCKWCLFMGTAWFCTMYISGPACTFTASLLNFYCWFMFKCMILSLSWTWGLNVVKLFNLFLYGRIHKVMIFAGNIRTPNSGGIMYLTLW